MNDIGDWWTLCIIKPAPTEQNINTHKSSLPPDYFTKYPTHSNTPKEYQSIAKKPMQLTTKAYLVQKIDRKTIEDLPPKEQMIDFNKFLLQFKSVDKIKDHRFIWYRFWIIRTIKRKM